MNHSLRRAGSRLALLLAAATAGAAFTPSTDAHAKEEERRALRLDEVDVTPEAESEELRALAEQKRLESISRLKSLLQDSPDDERKAEMMLRLSDLYFEQGRADFFDEMDRFNKEFDDCFNTAEDSTVCESIEADHTNSSGWYKKSIKLYEAILKRYPRHRKADQATFYLGMTYKEINEEKKSVDAFKKLVKLYSSSSYVPDAYVLIGEYYFDRNEAFPALRAYSKASQYKDHRQWGYATYKLAWCYFNVEEYDKAIGRMKAVISDSMEQGGGDASKVRLENEALKDLVRFFAEAGAMDDAYAYFTKLGRPELIRAMLQRLAGIYNEQGKYVQEVDTYRRLIGEDPNHPDCPDYQNSIISAYNSMGDQKGMLTEIRKLRSEYGSTSAWWRTNQSNPKATQKANEVIERRLRVTAYEFNKEAREAQKSRVKGYKKKFDAAIEAYETYFESYNDDPKSYESHYDFANLLWELKKYEGAYTQYMKVVSLDPQGKNSQDSAESAIFASEKMVESEGGGKVSTKAVKVDKDVQPVPLSDWEQKLIAACGQYAELYEGDKKVEIAIYKSAYLLYSRFHFNDAASQFRKVISRWPKSENAERAANLILEALAIRQETATIKETSKAFYEQEGLGSSKFKKEMYTIYSSSSFKLIEEQFEANKDYNVAADAFVAFYDEFPDFDKVDFALNNAAFYYSQVGRVADATRIRHILVEDPKFGEKTQFYFDQVGNLGYDYERLADFEKVVQYYDLFFKLYPEEREKLEKSKAEGKDEALAAMDKRAALALYSAALFDNALGNWEAAVDRYKVFLDKFPEHELALGLRLTVPKLLEQHEQYADAAKAFRAYYEKPPEGSTTEDVFYARLHEGRSLIAAGETSSAMKSYKSSVAAYKKLRDGGASEEELYNYTVAEAVAEMMHALIQPKFEEYMATRIRSAGITNGDSLSGSRLRSAMKKEDSIMKADLQKKTKLLKELRDGYEEIVLTRAEAGGIQANNAMGRLFDDMATTWTESPDPFYLTEDQVDIYRMQINDRVYGLVENAVSFYSTTLERSYTSHLYNDATAFATRRLGELRPEDFPGLEERIPSGGLTSETVRRYEPETSLD